MPPPLLAMAPKRTRTLMPTKGAARGPAEDQARPTRRSRSPTRRSRTLTAASASEHGRRPGSPNTGPESPWGQCGVGFNLESAGVAAEGRREDRQRVLAKRRHVQDEDEEDSEESSAEPEADLSEGTLQERRRARRRLSRYFAEAMDSSASGSSFLERCSVSPITLTGYQKAVEEFRKFSRSRRLVLRGDERVDSALVEYFHARYFEGKHPSMAERTLAGLMMLDPNYSQLGHARIPRAWRALRGWRRLTPTVSRKPLPWPFWTRVAELLTEQHLGMGVFVLMGVSGYFRPSELMSLRRCDLIAPAPGVLAVWSVLLFPEEKKKASKTGVFSDSVELDDERLLWLDPIWRSMAKEGDERSAWGFSYPEFAAAFKRTVAAMGVGHVVAYQMRHSGPSIDLADRRRTLAEAQRRGRWAQPRSMLRYERRARLAAEWAKLSPDLRRECEQSVNRVGDVCLSRFRTSRSGGPMAASRAATSQSSWDRAKREAQ